MALYVDGFLLPVPKRKLDAYRRMARAVGKVWMEHGALEYRECVGDDMKPKPSAAFRRGVRLKPREVVVFSWTVYKSRAHRDRVNKKAMKDPRIMKYANAVMPFDMKRLGWGGFKVLVEY
jgi:uncharacterized protein YbaA (DUF1428 family)